MALLELRGIGKSFEGYCALDGIDLDVDAATIHGLIGPNGAGKSTLLHVIAGDVPHDRGTIVFAGTDLRRSDAITRARLGLALQCQVPCVFPQLRVIDNLAMAARSPGARRRGGAMTVADAVELVHLGECLERRASEISHGQRKWLELGMCLLAQPQVLLLDEPTAGMTITERAATAEMLGTVVRDVVTSTIVVEHDVEFVRNVCDVISVLHRGSVIGHGDFATLSTTAAVQEAYLGFA